VRGGQLGEWVTTKKKKKRKEKKQSEKMDSSNSEYQVASKWDRAIEKGIYRVGWGLLGGAALSLLTSKF
jgi:hypothetical protein